MNYIDSYLKGYFLVAAPAIGDERFDKSVIYIYNHDENGASGIIINQPSVHLDFAELCDQLSIEINSYTAQLFDGGPVDGNRGFVLHSNDFRGRDTIDITDTALCLTTTVDIIKHIANGTGPQKSIITLGCAKWSAGQLENELTRHGWLLAKADMDILFDVPYKNRWDFVIKRMGIESACLSEYTGRA